jgi:hypothetical protein
VCARECALCVRVFVLVTDLTKPIERRARTSEDIVTSYALDNMKSKIWWAAFLRETHSLRDNKGVLDAPSSPEYYIKPWENQWSPVGGGVAGAAAPYFNYESPLDSPVPSTIEISPEAERLVTELAMFFHSRRVDVSISKSAIDLFLDCHRQSMLSSPGSCTHLPALMYAEYVFGRAPCAGSSGGKCLRGL